VACLCQKGLAIPLPFGGDLRKQQASMVAAFNNEAMLADGDFLGRRDTRERSQQR